MTKYKEIEHRPCLRCGKEYEPWRRKICKECYNYEAHLIYENKKNYTAHLEGIIKEANLWHLVNNK